MNKNVKDVLKVSISNFLLLISGVVTSFILPKVFTLTDFGYYKIFNLYITYIIFLQFGISEGMYLRYGGKDYTDLSKSEISDGLNFIVLSNIAISVLLLFFVSFFNSEDYKYIGIYLALSIIVVNITNYFQYISQSLSLFNEIAIRNLVRSLLTIIAVIVIWVINSLTMIRMSYKTYIFFIFIINIVLMIWYLYSYRKSLDKRISIDKNFIKKLIKLGIPLMFSNMISTLIFTVDRQMVSVLYSPNEYAIYSFAYNMLTLALVFISSISVVIFPIIKNTSKNNLKLNYSKYISGINIIVSIMVLTYYPLNYIIREFLPVYIDSLEILRAIMPGVMISSPITIVMHNYFKSLDYNKTYLKISVGIILLSILLNIIAYKYFGTMFSISLISNISFLLWYFLLENKLRKQFIIERKHLVFIFTQSVLFLSLHYLGLNIYKEFILNIFIITILITIFYRKNASNIFKLTWRKIEKKSTKNSK